MEETNKKERDGYKLVWLSLLVFIVLILLSFRSCNTDLSNEKNLDSRIKSGYESSVIDTLFQSKDSLELIALTKKEDSIWGITKNAEESILIIEKSKVESVKKEELSGKKTKLEADDKLHLVVKEIAENMIYVKGGTFKMGCPDYYRPPNWEDNKQKKYGASRYGECAQIEQPAHDVSLSDFSISKYEVTQKQWKVIMGTNPSSFKGCEDCPIESISWEEIQNFLEKLNNVSGRNYRLPTEAEWEYAAHGGLKSKYRYKFAGGNDLDSVAWHSKNSNLKTHPVGLRNANELGLFDMTGNVEEFCHDWYYRYYYGISSKTDPKGPPTGKVHVRRGGDFNTYILNSRITEREIFNFEENRRSPRFGFRLAE